MSRSNLRIFLSRRKDEFMTGLKTYSCSLCKFKKTAVAVCDGLYYSGGMTDRFKSIISLYSYAKKINVPFRIQYTYPFNLTDYLVPNRYNWVPSERDYIKSIFTGRIFHVVAEPKHIFRLYFLLIFGIRQIHYYGNRDVTHFRDNTMWGQCFLELFKPSIRLETKLNNLKQTIGGLYFSIVFRFQNLLGDFKEYDFQPLEDNPKQKLINDCIKQLLSIQKKHSGEKCLVTSDSITFLDTINNIENVFIIPGKLIHMGDSINGSL